MTHTSLGNALGVLGDMAASMASHRCAAEIDPGNALARFNLGRALVEAGQPEAALEHLRAAIRLAPQAGAAWQWLASCTGAAPV